ncbi:hypothetical protein Lal_00043038 [Lupinus albus]|nr:hypothetical protein Lal_00043038 [Lupinus albus]
MGENAKTRERMRRRRGLGEGSISSSLLSGDRGDNRSYAPRTIEPEEEDARDSLLLAGTGAHGTEPHSLLLLFGK